MKSFHKLLTNHLECNGANVFGVHANTKVTYDGADISCVISGRMYGRKDGATYSIDLDDVNWDLVYVYKVDMEWQQL